MDEHSLILKIADLLIKFYCKQKTDASFLKSKYNNFLVKKDISPKSIANIFFVKKQRSKRIQTKRNNFYLPVLPLKKNFKLFNDLCRIVFIYLLNKNKGFILHASSLVKSNYGFIFAGQEDSGKSTIRKLFPELVCLGDDSAIVRKVNNQFFLFGSPFYQKTNRAYPNQRVPIKGVFALKQADFDLVRFLSFPEDIKAALTDVYIANIGKKSEEKELLLKNCSDFCQGDKVFSLFFKKDRSFWALLEKVADEKWEVEKTGRIIKSINPQVFKKLPLGIIWSPAVGSWEFLRNCLVINEASWKFEFDGERKIGQIAKFISQLRVFSPHIKLINKVRRKINKKANDQWIILIHKDSVYTIIDGNHKAVAAHQLGKEGKNFNLKFLIGKLPSGKKCMWC